MRVYEKIEAVKQDSTSGASELARKSLEVLSAFAKNTKSKTYANFMENFEEIGRNLFEARPNMAAVQNCIAQIVYEVKTLQERNLDSLRKKIVLRIDELIFQSENAVREAAKFGAKLISSKCCVASCSYSSTIAQTFNWARQSGKLFNVFISESKSDDKLFAYGKVLAEFLESINVSAKVFPDNEIDKYIPKAEIVLVGADSILYDGSIINGTPTYDVALKAAEHCIPFYSICDTSKVNVSSRLGHFVELKKGFEIVPFKFIKGIVTEKGILYNKEIAKIVEEKMKYFRIF